ncbi:MAG: hypothetical protein RL689_2567 [Planctomycetota bacterium]|jgi:hypothetical protein
MPPPSARSSAAQRPNGYTLEWAEHELEPADGLVENPTWQDVEAIIGNLTVGEEPRGFVILRRAETDFFQCARVEDGLVAELHDPTDDSHHELAAGVAPPEFVLRIARTWFDNPPAAAGLDVWTPLEL